MSTLDTLAVAEDPDVLRRGVQSAVRAIAGCVEQMRRENDLVVAQFRDEMRTMQHRVEAAEAGAAIDTGTGALKRSEFKFARQGQTSSNTTPTAAGRAGDFNASTLAAPIDPTTNAPFPNRMVPAGRWSKNGPLLLKPYPLPNFVGPGGTNISTGIAIPNYREELLRLDYNFSQNTQLSYRLTNDKQDLVFPFRNNTFACVPNPRPRPGYITSIALQHSFSPTMINTSASTSARMQSTVRRTSLPSHGPPLT